MRLHLFACFAVCKCACVNRCPPLSCVRLDIGLCKHLDWCESPPPSPQATSSIFHALWEVPFSSLYGSRPSSWSMLKSSLINLGVRHADCVASLKLKPDVKTEVWKTGETKSSFAIVWDFSVDGFSGSGSRQTNHIPNISERKVNRRFCRSEVAFSTLSSITFFINFVNSSNSNFGSSTFFFQSSSTRSNPSFFGNFNVFPSNSLSRQNHRWSRPCTRLQDPSCANFPGTPKRTPRRCSHGYSSQVFLAFLDAVRRASSC